MALLVRLDMTVLTVESDHLVQLESVVSPARRATLVCQDYRDHSAKRAVKDHQVHLD